MMSGTAMIETMLPDLKQVTTVKYAGLCPNDRLEVFMRYISSM